MYKLRLAHIIGKNIAILNEGVPNTSDNKVFIKTMVRQVRLAAGGALATAHERCCEDEDEEWSEAAAAAALPRLQRLARDSHKYRAKRDRKLQRATFRDILKYFEVCTMYHEPLLLLLSTYRFLL